jgi:hypothetical protein
MIVAIKIYKYKQNNKEYNVRIPQIKCECGLIVGKYKIKNHRTRWTHFYYLGKLDEFNSEEKILS